MVPAYAGFSDTKVIPSQYSGYCKVADPPLARNDGVIRPVVVDPGAEAGRAELERQYNSTAAFSNRNSHSRRF